MERKYKERVELHCHTTNSEEDGVSTLEEIMAFVKENKMPAVAITDHSEFLNPEEVEKLGLSEEGPKIIYGSEVYAVIDDECAFKLNGNEGDFSFDDEFVIVDIETNGFSPITNEIIMIEAVKFKKDVAVSSFKSYIKPECSLSKKVENLTGISNCLLADERKLEEVFPDFLEFLGNAVYVGYHTDFDFKFMKASAKRLNCSFDPPVLDLVRLARRLVPDAESYRLKDVGKELGVKFDTDNDLEYIIKVYSVLVKKVKEKGIHNLCELNDYYTDYTEYIRRLPTYHVTVLAKNIEGCKVLDEILYDTYENYYYIRPKLRLSELLKNREYLLIGSACEAGILNQKLLDGVSDESLEEIVQMYDFLEIQPIENDKFMIKDEYRSDINTEDDLISVRKKIIALGKKYHIPVVATSDVHFLRPEDSVKRAQIMEEAGYTNPWEQMPVYFRTTEEMLKAFDFLDEEERYRIVIENSNVIAEKIKM